MRSTKEAARCSRQATVGVERRVYSPMDWFFQQWENGSAIPTHTFSDQYEERAGGVIATVRVRQEPTLRLRSGGGPPYPSGSTASRTRPTTSLRYESKPPGLGPRRTITMSRDGMIMVV